MDNSTKIGKPLDGLLVVALEQAVAAPFCTSRLADAGARVIKIERPEGDFARGYDKAVFGESSYFVWINRGKESLALDLREKSAREHVAKLLETADVFIQNFAPGAADRLAHRASVVPQRACGRAGRLRAGLPDRLLFSRHSVCSTPCHRILGSLNASPPSLPVP
jgi:hypothetical protein